MITLVTITLTQFSVFSRVSVIGSIALMWVTAITILAFHQYILDLYQDIQGIK